MPSKQKSPTQFKLYASHQHLCDAASAESLTSVRRAVAKINPVNADGVINVTITHIYIPHIHLWRSHTVGPLDIELPSKADRQIFYLPGQGRVAVETRAGTLVCDAATGLAAEIQAVQKIRIEEERLGLGLTVSRRALSHRLSKRLDGALHGPITFDPQFRGDTAELLGVAQMLNTILDSSSAGALFHSNDTAEAISTSVMDLLLDHVPNNYSLELDQASNAVLPGYVARAVHLMNTATDLSVLTIEGVANACGVSVRKLQYGFSEYRRVSPIKHLRALRLQHARKLIAAGGALSLLQIAQSLGFSNYARFSKQYLEAFGETPKQTRGAQDIRL